MAGFHTAAMPRPQSQGRPATPVVDIALVRPQQAAPEAPSKPVRASPYGRRMTAEQKDHARKRAAEGWPLAAIAAELGFGATAIWNATRGIARVAGAAMVETRQAEREAAQAEVRLLKSRGLNDGEVARRLGMSRSNVRKLKVSPKEYERYLAKARKDSKARNVQRRKARRGLRSNFLAGTARAVRIATGIGLPEMKAAETDLPRPPGFVRARQILCWLAVRHRGFPAHRVGAELGIDHSTVLNAVKVVQAVADETELPSFWRPLYPVVTALIDAMQRGAAERRQAQAGRRPEIPTP